MEPAENVDAIRRFLLALLGVGLLGTGVELVLLDHYEDGWQIVPLVLIALAIAVIVWTAAAGSAASVRALQGTMALLVAAAGVGLVLHYRGNVEFQLETDPTQHGWPLLLKVLRAKAPPALAPGVMAQLGALGLACTYRHPALTRTSTTTGEHS